MRLCFILFSMVTAKVISFEWKFNRCPEPCRCYLEKSVNVLDCSTTYLEQFPQPETIPSDVQLINMSRNSIRSIPDSYKFWFPECAELDISHNELKNVPNLEGFYRLKRLNLEYNGITSLPEEAFVHLSYLEELLLGGNQISHISEAAFKNLYSLQKLNLSCNKLETLPSAVDSLNLKELYFNGNLIENPVLEFLNLSELRRLSLAWNRISRMGSQVLQNSQKLEYLDLAHNRFLEVPQQTLRVVAATLVNLNLSSTPITRIKSGDFINLGSLQVIDLSNTNIATIEENSFRNLPKLLRIYLNDNRQLVYISYGAFRLLPSLSLIYLHNSDLTGLHDFPEELPSLQQLTLYGNPLLCDCNSKWVQRSRNIMLHEEQMTCISDSTSGGPSQNLNFSAVEIPDKCAPRILSLPINITAVEGQRLILNCDALGNPKPTIQWRSPYNSFMSEGPYVIFQKIAQNQTGSYRCLAYSEAGFAEANIFVDVVPRLQLRVLSINPTTAQVTWTGKLPPVTSKLRVRFRDNSTEFMRDVAVNEQTTTVRLFWDVFSDNFELCLMDGTLELVCDVFVNTKDRRWAEFLFPFLFVTFFIAMFWSCDCFGIRDDCDVDTVVNEPAKSEADKPNKKKKNENSSKFYYSSADAAEMLTRPKMHCK